jgi:hypothetical protein
VESVPLELSQFVNTVQPHFHGSDSGSQARQSVTKERHQFANVGVQRRFSAQA